VFYLKEPAMARIARVVLPGLPHYVTQRGKRHQQTFFVDEDYVEYRRLLAASRKRCGTAVLAYCLMPHDVHLVLVPSHEDGLRCALAEAHRYYTRRINFRKGWRGSLWQERFHSFAMDQPHLLATARSIERNPVRAGLCRTPEQWPWSSARAHLCGEDDDLVQTGPLLDLMPDWASYLADDQADHLADQFQRQAQVGRPLGSEDFIKEIETRLGRVLRPRKPGPKTRDKPARSLDE
jgi:putative transposase